MERHPFLGKLGLLSHNIAQIAKGTSVFLKKEFPVVCTLRYMSYQQTWLKVKQAHQPTIYDSYSTTIEADRKFFELILADTAGKSEYSAFRPLIYEGAHAVLLCLAIDDRKAIERIPHQVGQSHHPFL